MPGAFVSFGPEQYPQSPGGDDIGRPVPPPTDSEGRFVFPIVRPDTYTLKATMAGFKALEQSNVVVAANDKFSAGQLTLE